MILRFLVKGVARPAGSKVSFNLMNKQGEPILNKKTGRPIIVTKDSSGENGENWRSDVREAFRTVGLDQPLTGPLQLKVTIFKTRPLGHFKKRKGVYTSEMNADGIASLYPTGSPDCTKLIRAIEDALNSLAWVDDSQIVTQSVSKRWGRFPSASITIATMEETI